MADETVSFGFFAPVMDSGRARAYLMKEAALLPVWECLP
jgi:hypothetical protein